MNENHTITLQDKKWGIPVRVLTLITFFLGAFTLVQAILLLSEYYSKHQCRHKGKWRNQQKQNDNRHRYIIIAG